MNDDQIREARERLAAALSKIPGLQASPYMLGSPTPPAAHIIPTAVSFDEAMAGGLDERTFTVQVFAALGLDKGAQIVLDGFLARSGPKSVKQALESDRRLGGLVQDLRVTEMSSYNVVTLDARQMLSADFTVVVYG